jgi:HEAT repeat protein
MIPALRLTTLLVCLPAAALVAQVPPRAPTPRTPAPRPERAPIAPRAERPWLDAPRFDELRDLKWDIDHDMKFEMLDGRLDMPKFEHLAPMADMNFEKFARFDQKFDAKFDAQFDKAEMKFHELDMKFGEGLMKAPRVEVHWDTDRESFATSPRRAWIQGDPADSVYKAAYELLNRGEWRRAAGAFANIPQKFPNSGYAADALYWQAFSLYRIGNTDDLQTAIRSLETMRSKYPQARTQSDAAALLTRIRGTLASRGDRTQEQELRKTIGEQGQPCDREDQQVRGEALKAIAQSDPASLPALVRRVLAKKDACSALLRRTAVYLLGNSRDNDAPAILRDVALNDSEPEVRSAALQYLAQSSSDIAVNTLEEVLRTSTDQGVLRSAARALAQSPNPKAKTAVRALIERTDAPERLRIEAVGGFENSERTTDDDVSYLRGVYTKIDNPRVKARIARVIGQLGGEQNDAWLMGLMRNNDEPLEVRRAALDRVASRKMPIADAVKLYANVADRQLREQLINVYAQRTEPEATDKLLDIVKNDTDYNLRRQAINAVTRKNDPRATKLLLEIIDK